MYERIACTYVSWDSDEIGLTRVSVFRMLSNCSIANKAREISPGGRRQVLCCRGYCRIGILALDGFYLP